MPVTLELRAKRGVTTIRDGYAILEQGIANKFND